jgi:YVTN family beta-propeller protein
MTGCRDFRRMATVTLAILGACLAGAHPARAGRVYVSNEDDGTVTVADTQQLAAISTIPAGKRPRGLVLSRDGSRLYVAVSGLPKCPPPMSDADCAKLPRDEQADGFAVIDTATFQCGTLRQFAGLTPTVAPRQALELPTGCNLRLAAAVDCYWLPASPSSPRMAILAVAALTGQAGEVIPIVTATFCAPLTV